MIQFTSRLASNIFKNVSLNTCIKNAEIKQNLINNFINFPVQQKLLNKPVLSILSTNITDVNSFSGLFLLQQIAYSFGKWTKKSHPLFKRSQLVPQLKKQQNKNIIKQKSQQNQHKKQKTPSIYDYLSFLQHHYEKFWKIQSKVDKIVYKDKIINKQFELLKYQNLVHIVNQQPSPFAYLQGYVEIAVITTSNKQFYKISYSKYGFQQNPQQRITYLRNNIQNMINKSPDLKGQKIQNIRIYSRKCQYSQNLTKILRFLLQEFKLSKSIKTKSYSYFTMGLEQKDVVQLIDQLVQTHKQFLKIIKPIKTIIDLIKKQKQNQNQK